jgi:hypothetical protein
MSDYLSNLIDRSFNLTAVIQPRLPTRFEPLQPSGEPQVEQFLEQEQEDRVPPPRISLSSFSQSLQLSPYSQPLTAGLNPLPPTQSIAGDSVIPLSLSELASKPIDQQRFVGQMNVPAEPSATSHSRSESHLIPQGLGDHQRFTLIKPQIVSLPESIAASVPIAQPEPPTIQVTIGRVEVRAISTASPPRQPAKSPTPNLSLEDYLRSGNGGRS